MCQTHSIGMLQKRNLFAFLHETIFLLLHKIFQWLFVENTSNSAIYSLPEPELALFFHRSRLCWVVRWIWVEEWPKYYICKLF